MDREMLPFLGIGDPISSLTHLGAALVFIFWARSMLRRASQLEPSRQLGLKVWCAASVWLFLVSGIYHYLPAGHSLRPLFWHLDHGSIWIGLAASFTAVMALLAPWDRRYLVLMWALAFIGAGLEMTILEQLPPYVSPLLYIGMGWAGFPLLLRLMRERKWAAAWFLAGGCSATLGGLMDSYNLPTLLPMVLEAHELHHVAIVVAVAFYYQTICRELDRELAPQMGPDAEQVQPSPA